MPVKFGNYLTTFFIYVKKVTHFVKRTRWTGGPKSRFWVEISTPFKWLIDFKIVDYVWVKKKMTYVTLIKMTGPDTFDRWGFFRNSYG